MPEVKNVKERRNPVWAALNLLLTHLAIGQPEVAKETRELAEKIDQEFEQTKPQGIDMQVQLGRFFDLQKEQNQRQHDLDSRLKKIEQDAVLELDSRLKKIEQDMNPKKQSATRIGRAAGDDPAGDQGKKPDQQ